MKNPLKMFRWFLMAIFIWQVASPCSAQTAKKDTVKYFRNTVRINITNPMLFGDKYNVLSYERVFRNNQSLTVGAGRFTLPSFGLINSDSVLLHSNYTEKGYTFIAEYRFYLKKENKYRAPRGLYIGPYYSLNYLERTNSWTLNTSYTNGNLNTNVRLTANLVGAQMGYQFVIKNRISIDFIFMGPGIWFYALNTKISTTLNAEDEAMLFEKINEILASKLPGHEITISPGEKQRTGSIRTESAGFRYLINLGFRF